ncbi:hypothetical protein HN51_016229 [Arachis hypogaea]
MATLSVWAPFSTITLDLTQNSSSSNNTNNTSTLPIRHHHSLNIVPLFHCYLFPIENPTNHRNSRHPWLIPSLQLSPPILTSPSLLQPPSPPSSEVTTTTITTTTRTITIIIIINQTALEMVTTTTTAAISSIIGTMMTKITSLLKTL